ncbi:MAG: D-aminoacyl-tRNA deacylase [Bacteroidota bacterium]
MRVIIQRVSEASVSIQLQTTSSIRSGLLILLGIEEADTIDDIEWLCAKISNLRIFNDAEGKMNLSIMEVGGEILIVSQFTLHASTRKGNRPSYIRAAKPDFAIPLYELFIKQMKLTSGLQIKTGEFGAMMQIQLINDGPVTIFIDSKQKE